MNTFHEVLLQQIILQDSPILIITLEILNRRSRVLALTEIFMFSLHTGMDVKQTLSDLLHVRGLLLAVHIETERIQRRLHRSGKRRSQLNTVPGLVLPTSKGSMGFGKGKGIFLVASNQSCE